MLKATAAASRGKKKGSFPSPLIDLLPKKNRLSTPIKTPKPPSRSLPRRSQPREKEKD
jgi:hypothetical protein